MEYKLNSRCTHDTDSELLNDYVQNFVPSKISSSSFMSSSSEQMLSTFTSISVTREDIKGLNY